MEKHFKNFVEIIKLFEEIEIISIDNESFSLEFKSKKDSFIEMLRNIVGDLEDCDLITEINTDNIEDIIYKLNFKTESSILFVSKILNSILETNEKNTKSKELGIPDLSLVTIRQIANELKTRNNLTFALVWIENSERDNIAIEGSGQPTQLIGLLARGTHMAIEWADKNIRFYRPGEND